MTPLIYWTLLRGARWDGSSSSSKALMKYILCASNRQFSLVFERASVPHFHFSFYVKWFTYAFRGGRGGGGGGCFAFIYVYTYTLLVVARAFRRARARVTTRWLTIKRNNKRIADACARACYLLIFMLLGVRVLVAAVYYFYVCPRHISAIARALHLQCMA